MAIAFDATVAAAYDAGTAVTVAHTCTGDDRILFATGTGNQGPTATLTATYDGVAMTAVGFSLDSIGSGVPTYLFYMINPPTGENDIVMTSSSNGVTCSSVSYTGVDQTTPIPESNATAIDATSTSMSKSLTTTVDNSWILMTFRTGNGFTLTAGTDTTIRQQPEDVAFGSGSILDNNAAITPAGSTTLAVTSSSQYWGGQVICSIAPAVAASFVPTMQIF